MSEPLLSVAEAAALLRVSTRTVRRLIDAAELPAYRVRGQLRLTKADLNEYLLARTR